MRKILIILLASLYFAGNTPAQVLNVPEVIQEQNQWCWAGVSKCILDYYTFPQSQCNIAEYARTVITWTSFGTTNCCVNPSLGCNYWNYNWGYPGSIQDILVHFGNIQNYGVSNNLTSNEILTEVSAGRPFVVRWQWYSGGGHFVVGHGINGNNVNYMDPWFGEGLHVSTYNWLVNDGVHNWDMTNIITTTPTSIEQETLSEEHIRVFPNPASDHLSICATDIIHTWELFDMIGQRVLHKDVGAATVDADISRFPRGIYNLIVYAGEERLVKKLVLK